MTRMTILPVRTGKGKSYFAVAGNKQAFGNTAGQALDALTVQLTPEETAAVVIVQPMRPDEFFGAAEQQRLEELMEKWRIARELNQVLAAGEQVELESLIEKELLASAARTRAILDELAR